MTFLRTYCPNLQQLSCASPNRAATVRISDYILQSHELRNVDCGLPSEAAMKHLMKLPTLKGFVVTVTEGDGQDNGDPGEPYEGYKGKFCPQLTTFRINSESLNRAELFFRNLQLSPTRLQFRITTMTQYEDMRRICKELPKHFSPAKLEKLQVTVEDIKSNPDLHGPDYDLDVHALKGLFQFKNLVEVRLEDLRVSLLDDHVMSLFVDSWPNIEVLKLGTGFDWQPESQDNVLIQQSEVTFKGLTTLVSGCRKLRVLGLVFDALILGQDNWNLQFHPRDQMNQNVEELDVGASLIGEAMPVAIFISSLMPKLRTLKSVTHCCRRGLVQPISDPRVSLWISVRQMLKSLVAVRNQGRREGQAGWVNSSDEEDD